MYISECLLLQVAANVETLACAAMIGVFVTSFQHASWIFLWSSMSILFSPCVGIILSDRHSAEEWHSWKQQALAFNKSVLPPPERLVGWCACSMSIASRMVCVNDSASLQVQGFGTDGRRRHTKKKKTVSSIFRIPGKLGIRYLDLAAMSRDPKYLVLR